MVKLDLSDSKDNQSVSQVNQKLLLETLAAEAGFAVQEDETGVDLILLQIEAPAVTAPLQEKDCRPQTAAITIRITNNQTTAVRSCA